MSTQKGTIAPVLIAVIVIGLLYFGYTYYNKPSLPTGTENYQTTTDTKTPAVREKATVPVRQETDKTISTVTLADSGFSPASIAIKAGEKVTFKNEGTGQMWVASAPHPTHTNYPGFDEKSGVGNGQSYEFTFTKIGSWKYHNHLNPTQFGTVVVQ